MDLTRAVAWMDAGLATLFGMAGIWLLRMADRAAEAAVQQYGRNVDSGAVESVIAIIYCAPCALGFSLASMALLFRWRIRWLAHWMAVGGVVIPVVLEVFWS
jgi:hypothetical protein